MRDKSKHFKRTFYAFLVFVATIILFIILFIATPRIMQKYSISAQEIESAKHFFLTLIAVSGVHLLDRWMLYKDMAEEYSKVFDDVSRVVSESLSRATGDIKTALNEDTRDIKITLGDLANLNRESIEGFQFISSAASCGLTNIYSSRHEAASDINDAISTAERRVLVLGVAFSENVLLTNFAEKLHEKKLLMKDNFELRVLLLNALRSPAIFRCFLESPPDKVADIMKFHREPQSTDDPIFQRRLYKDFNVAYQTLRTYPMLENATRFYAHSPSCWMVIVDDLIFFQPYTFGKSKEHRMHQENLCLGSHMPVFKFKKQASSKPFEILEDHFVKLWDTSDNDMFHIGAQLEDRRAVIRGIFRQRHRWLENVARVLTMPEQETKGGSHVKDHREESHIKDRRNFTRQPCKSSQRFHVSWQEGGHEVKASIKDFSLKGICLETSDDISTVKVGDKLTLEVTPIARTDSARFVIRKLFRDNDYEFTVKDIRMGRPTTIRLHTAKTEKIVS